MFHSIVFFSSTQHVHCIKIMLSTKLIIYSWISFCIFHWNELYILSVAGSPANSIQLATGEWDVKIGGGFWMDASRIFPPVTSPNSAKRITQSKGKSNFSTTKPFVKRRPWGASMDCILSLASDGTFVLTPKFVINDQGNKFSPKGRFAKFVLQPNAPFSMAAYHDLGSSSHRMATSLPATNNAAFEDSSSSSVPPPMAKSSA